MNKQWLSILLFISLAFNLAVIGSFIYLRTTHGLPHSRVPREEGHRRNRDRHGDTPRFQDNEQVSKLREEFHGTKRELMTELAKDPINEARLTSIVDSSLVIQSKLERELGTALIKLRRTMTAAEAKEFFTKRMDNMKNMRHNRQRTSNRTRRN